MKCCGEERETAYCPHCGTLLDADPLTQIKAHIKGLIRKKDAVLRRHAEWDASHPEPADPYSRILRKKRHARELARYKTWLATLEQLKPQLKETT